MSRHVLHPAHTVAVPPHAMSQGLNDRPEIETRFADRNGGEVQTLQQVLQLIQARHDEISAALQPIIERVQKDLNSLEGIAFDTLTDNKTMTREIQHLLNRLGVAVRCLRCHEPARIRCGKAGALETGAFQFDHAPAGHRTSHGGSRRLPQLTLVSSSLAQCLNEKPASNRVSS